MRYVMVVKFVYLELSMGKKVLVIYIWFYSKDCGIDVRCIYSIKWWNNYNEGKDKLFFWCR